MSALTKMFVVLQLVFSLALAVLLVLMISKQENYREISEQDRAGRAALAVQVSSEKEQVTAAQGAAQDATKKLTEALTQLDATKAQLASAQGNLDAARLQADTSAHTAQVQLANLTTANNTLAAANKAQAAELDSLRPKVADLTTKNSELSRAKNEADNQIAAAEQAIRKLQEQIATMSQTAPAAGASGAGGSVASLSSGNSAAGPVNARITDVQEENGRTLVQMPLGTRDGIQNGTRLMIYRNNTYITDAVVRRAASNESVAEVQGTAASSVKQGDMISTIGQ